MLGLWLGWKLWQSQLEFTDAGDCAELWCKLFEMVVPGTVE